MFYDQKFIVVTGVSKSHLLRTARLLHESKLLKCAITSYVPSQGKAFKFYPRSIRHKFHSRMENIESVPRTSFLIPELIYQIGRALHRNSYLDIADKCLALSFKVNSILSNRIITISPNTSKQIVLVRAGFGTKIDFGNRIFVCDASLAHPMTIRQLLESGRFGLSPANELSEVDKIILADIHLADVILVNSEFVRESFIFAGVDPEKIVTAYLPPLPQFQTPTKRVKKSEGPLKLLYAGGLEKRKGIQLLSELIDLLGISAINFEFNFIGNWGQVAPEFKMNLLSKENVYWTGWVTEAELSKRMQESDIFIFPSYAEGGARVVTEAMALGLPVITSWNSGSPITHGRDGIICELYSASIFDWIVKFIDDPDKMMEIGINAKQTISESVSDEVYLSKFNIDFSKYK